MARDPRDESLYKHKQWLGYLQPVGLVVSPPALVDADCHLNTDIATEYAQFVACTAEQFLPTKSEPERVIPQLKPVLFEVLGWRESDLVPANDPQAANLNVYLEGYDDHLQPSFAVVEDPKATEPKWLMLIQELPLGQSFDDVPHGETRKWQATPEARFERLLRETQVPTGLLSNGYELRLVYAPRGESPGHITFPVSIMLETAGRMVFSALYMLLRESRVFGSTGGKTLADILAASRKYQNTVSTELAEQVLAALYELLRGFQAADAHRKGELLREVLAKDPDSVYAAQLTVLLRLVFLLYAEDRGLMSDAEIYIKHYSVTGLFDKLRADAGRHPDTMDQRYGAWARLITLFRMVHNGARGGGIHLPARQGYLFDPDRYPFLEGRAYQSRYHPKERITPPAVSDGVIFRVLSNLMILDGERLSYRALDVEQIGSVYEAMMGFRIEVAQGRSIAIKPKKRHGAPVSINLEALLAVSGEKRSKLFAELADLKLTPKEAAALKEANTPQDVVAALDRKVKKEVTPNIVPQGNMVLQPSDERRRSGSHYTPRSLTEPIVRKALEPVLAALTPQPPLPNGEGEPDSIAGRDRKIPEALLTRARELRQTQTPAEQFLWECVRDRQLLGAKFRRQHNLGPFIADFYCHESRLCIELDGGIHTTAEQMEKDAARDQWMLENSIKVLRLTNEEVLQNPSDALERIAAALSPLSPGRGAGGEGVLRAGAGGGLGPTPKQILDLKVCDPAMGSGAFLVEACRQLGEVLVKAWHAHNQLPKIPPDEDELLHAQRLIAQRCLYGVDKNPMAVDLAKLSLWLVTLAKEHPFTFVDHTLRCGDSLVGLTLKQIKDFHWLSIKNQTMPFGQDVIIDRIKSATAYRQKILDAGDYMLPGMKESQLKLADEALNLVRFAGNLVIAAFFAEEKDNRRKAKRDQYLELLSENLQGNVSLRPTKQEAALLTGDKAILPFHWEIEFPEVFGKKDGGFDCIVGNPPFAGKNTIGDGNRPGFLDWLKALHAESHGNADLVAHFFRRAFNLLRKDGTFGLIATNTIAQGDTRSSGLRWICTHGGTIYSAKRRYKWPGQAAVVVSVVHIAKGSVSGPYELDDREVPKITAYLFHAGGHDDPARLEANAGKSFQGSIVLGMGFTFDDNTNDPAANPISLMHELIAKNPKNAERIFPYIGGEEINNSPTHAHHRYVINLGDMSEEQARTGWPDLMKIVEEKVKPQRKAQGDKIGQEVWWLFLRTRPELANAVKGFSKVLVTPIVSGNLNFAFVPAGTVMAHKLCVFSLASFTGFVCLQSRIHEIWTRFFTSTMKDDLNYSPSDCFETFPFPPNFERHPALETIGQEYYEFRADLMVKHNEGLTKTYNRFHDPHETNPDILKLRDLHDQMDRAVLQAYGPPFSDLVVPECKFLLDYEEEDDDEEETTGRRQRRKPYRYRWPDTFRDEVLALLLELNKQRAEEEKDAKQPKAKKSSGRRTRRANDPQSELPGMGMAEDS